MDTGPRQEAIAGVDRQGAATGVRSPVEHYDRPQSSQDAQDTGTPIPERRSGRERRPVRFFDEARGATDRPSVPLTYEEAVNNKIYGQNWKDAIKDELIKLQALDTWEFTDLPEDRRPVGSK